MNAYESIGVAAVLCAVVFVSLWIGSGIVSNWRARRASRRRLRANIDRLNIQESP